MSDPLGRLAPVVRLAPAKLNLSLAVTGRLPDRYHALHSVMVPLELADRLSLAPSAGREDTLHVAGPDTGPLAENLVLRAIAGTRAAVAGRWRAEGRAGGAPPALAVRLEKRIPVAAGLAGGSSDAAATIDAALECWGIELDDTSRARVALGLGSDVPFFLAGSPAVVEGRGERVTPLPVLRGDAAGVLLVTPPLAVRTPDVFTIFDAGARSATGPATAASRHLADEWRAGMDAARLLQRAGVLASANDLLAATAVVAPQALALRRALVRLLGRPVGQSGSGPTCWVLYPSLAEAFAAAARVEAAAANGLVPATNGVVAFAGDSLFVAATAITGDGSAAQAGGGAATGQPVELMPRVASTGTRGRVGE